MGLIAYENLKGFIGRSAVDDNVLHIPAGLVFHRLQGRGDAVPRFREAVTTEKNGRVVG